MSSASLTLILHPLVVRTVSTSVSVISGWAPFLILLVPHHHTQPPNAAAVEFSLAVQNSYSLGVHHLDKDSLLRLVGEGASVLLDDLHGEGDLLLLQVLGGVVFPHVTGLIPG